MSVRALLERVPGRVRQLNERQLFSRPKLSGVVSNAWGTASYVPQLWRRGPQGVLNRGGFENFKILS